MTVVGTFFLGAARKGKKDSPQGTEGTVNHYWEKVPTSMGGVGERSRQKLEKAVISGRWRKRKFEKRDQKTMPKKTILTYLHEALLETVGD